MTGAGRAVMVAAAWAGLTCGAVAAGPLPEFVSPKLIPGYTLLRPDVAGSGAPTEEGIAQLRALGIGVVVDLRAPEEGTATEVDDADRGPVLIHCATGNRVGGVWMALQVTQGVPYDEAEAEGRRIGLRSAPMIAAVRRVVGGPSR